MTIKSSWYYRKDPGVLELNMIIKNQNRFHRIPYTIYHIPYTIYHIPYTIHFEKRINSALNYISTF